MLRKYSAIARMNILNALQYPANLVARIVFYTVFISIFFCLWGDIYQNSAVHGYTFTQMIWYLCITELITFCARSDIYRQMSTDIKNGDIAYLLVRPCNYVWFQFSFSLGEMLASLAMFGCYAIVLAWVYVGPLPCFPLDGIIPMFLSVLLGIAINFFMLMILGMTAFIWEENSGFYLVFQKLVFMLGMFMPVEFLPMWLQNITKLLPFSYITWAPARLIVAFDWAFFWQVFPMQLMWAVGIIALAMFVYSRAVVYVQGQGG